MSKMIIYPFIDSFSQATEMSIFRPTIKKSQTCTRPGVRRLKTIQRLKLTFFACKFENIVQEMDDILGWTVSHNAGRTGEVMYTNYEEMRWCSQITKVNSEERSENKERIIMNLRFSCSFNPLSYQYPVDELSNSHMSMTIKLLSLAHDGYPQTVQEILYIN